MDTQDPDRNGEARSGRARRGLANMVTEGSSSVRIATSADERAIYALLVGMHRYNENGWGVPYDPSVVIGRIQQGTRPTPSTRSNPHDHVLGVIGVIDGGNGDLLGTVGIFLEPAMWFAGMQACLPIELWLYVKQDARDRRRLELALRDFALDVKEKLKPETHPCRWLLQTGFMHVGARYPGMERLWRRLWPGSRQVGSLFWTD
jgi:hypothetical protein